MNPTIIPKNSIKENKEEKIVIDKTTEVKEELVENTEEVNRTETTDELPDYPVDEEPVEEVQGVEPPIYDSLSALEAYLDEVDEVEEGKASVNAGDKTTAQDLLKNIVIDLNNIEISSNEQFSFERTQNLYESVPTRQVVCCQSAYTAQLSALKSKEITNLVESESDYFTYRKKIAKIVHKHIESTSVGKMNFADWEKYTSFYDFETILYGIYCQTFPYENKYSVRCPGKDCGAVITSVANNNTLVETRGKEDVFARVNDVIASVKTPQQSFEKSVTHKTKRVVLEESKIIVDIIIPTLHDYLEGILSKITPEFSEQYQTSLGLALFIDKLYIPDLAKLKDTGKLSYFEIKDKLEIVRYLGDIAPYYDVVQLTELIDEFTERYRVTYSLKNVTCPECGHVIETVNLDMEELLFLTIRQGRVK